MKKWKEKAEEQKAYEDNLLLRAYNLQNKGQRMKWWEDEELAEWLKKHNVPKEI